LFLSGTSSLQPCCVVLKHSIQEPHLHDQRHAKGKISHRLF
jgi:hypothetical protein